MKFLLRPRKIAFLLSTLSIAGCSLLTGPQITPTRYWVLSSSESQRVSDPDKATAKLSIGVGPFSFPSYLKRPLLARRNDGNEISFLATNRWAESLPDGFLRSLRGEISTDLGTDDINLFPWYSTKIDYQVKGEIFRFEANDNGSVTLDCLWNLYRPSDKTVILTHHTRLERSLPDRTPQAMASGLSDLIAGLGQEVSRAIAANAPAG